MNLVTAYKYNLRELAKQVGCVTELGKRLKKPQSQISHLIGIRPSKNVGDRIAAQIEHVFHKPPGWLDQWYNKRTINAKSENLVEGVSLGSVQWLPVIRWDEIQAFVKHPKSILPETYHSVSNHFNLGKESFVVKVNNTILQESLDIHINGEGLLIVDPTNTAHENAFVIAQEKGKNKSLLLPNFRNKHRRREI